MRNRVRRATFLCVLLAVSLPVFAQDSAVSLNEQGRDAYEAGDYYAAVELYRTAANKNPSYGKPLIGLAESYFALGEYAEALANVQKAKQFDRGSVYITALEGRIQIGLGAFDSARKLFEQVLIREPNNLDARFGLAELDIAAGKTKNAIDRFHEALRVSPDNRRALLSLIVLYDDMNETAKSEEYVKQALRYYTGNPLVHFFAGRHYLKKGRLSDSEREARTALSVKPDYIDATILLATVYLRKSEYEKVPPLLEEALKRRRNEHLLWYMMGKSQEKLGNLEQSVYGYETALGLRPDDEITRIALENLLIQKFDMKDEVRAKYADFRFSQGKDFDGRNLLPKALQEYRRGLMLNPYSLSGRLLYANLFKRMGFRSKYLSILTILQKEGAKDTDIKDNIEIYTNLLDEEVSRTWKVDQFILQRSKFSFSLFYTDTTASADHYGGDEAEAILFQSLLLGFENLDVSRPKTSNGFSDMYRSARESGSDYFLELSVTEMSRAFDITVNLYHAGTGRLLSTFHTYRTGNNRLQDGLLSIATSVSASLPLRGTLLQKKFDTGLIDLGGIDGIKKGDVLSIVKKGSLQLAKDAVGLSYPDESLVGTFTVTRVDDLISEGTLAKNGFFDLINPGDSLIMKPKEEKPVKETEIVQRDTYKTLLTIPAGN